LAGLPQGLALDLMEVRGVRGMEAHYRQTQPFWVNGEGQGELNRTASCPDFSTTKNPLDPPLTKGNKGVTANCFYRLVQDLLIKP
jgi:hypothetical protein